MKPAWPGRPWYVVPGMPLFMKLKNIKKKTVKSRKDFVENSSLQAVCMSCDAFFDHAYDGFCLCGLMQDTTCLVHEDIHR